MNRIRTIKITEKGQDFLKRLYQDIGETLIDIDDKNILNERIANYFEILAHKGVLEIEF